MDLATLIGTIAIGLTTILLPFYLSDVSNLKKQKLKIKNNNFLNGLKIKLIGEILYDKKIFLIFYFISFFSLIIMLTLQSSLYNTLYDSTFSNPTLANKTIEEKTIIAKNIASSSTNLNVFSGFFLITCFIIFCAYFYSKFNKQLLIEQSVTRESIKDLLLELKINKTEIDFYIAVVEKFGKIKDEKIYNSLAEFIYSTLEFSGRYK